MARRAARSAAPDVDVAESVDVNESAPTDLDTDEAATDTNESVDVNESAPTGSKGRDAFVVGTFFAWTDKDGVRHRAAQGECVNAPRPVIEHGMSLGLLAYAVPSSTHTD